MAKNKLTNERYVPQAYFKSFSNLNEQLNYDSKIRIENDFMVEFLKRLGFKGSNIGYEYLRKYTKYFRKISYIGRTTDEI